MAICITDRYAILISFFSKDLILVLKQPTYPLLICNLSEAFANFPFVIMHLERIHMSLADGVVSYPEGYQICFSSRNFRLLRHPFGADLHVPICIRTKDYISSIVSWTSSSRTCICCKSSASALSVRHHRMDVAVAKRAHM